MAFKVVSSKQVDLNGAPIRTQIELRDRALRLFSKREMNAILSEAARQMGLAWISRWLPKRFTNYAYKLGYNVSAYYYDYKKSKMADPAPLIGPPPELRIRKRGKGGYIYGTQGDGNKLVNSSQQASASSSAAGGNPSVTIRIPTRHPIAPNVTATLRTIPAIEIKDIAKDFGDTLQEMILGASHTSVKRMQLTESQRGSLAVGRKTSGSGARSSRSRKTA